jgi:hypothetical protein
VVELLEKGVPLIPVSVDPDEGGPFMRLMDSPQPVDLRTAPEGWCNFWRQDDWSATTYFYLDSAGGLLPPIAPATFRAAGLATARDAPA